MSGGINFLDLKYSASKWSIILCCSFLSKGLLGQELFVEFDSTYKEQSNAESKVGVLRLLFLGASFQRQSKPTSWRVPSVFDVVQFNTVEGLVLNPSISFTKFLKEKKFYTITPNLRYGVDNRRAQAQISASYFFNPKKFTSIKFSGGQFVKQINENSSLDAFGNSFNTLLFQRNYLKIFETTFLKITHIYAPLKDFVLTNTLNWEDRKPLQNDEEFNGVNNGFTSNIPKNEKLESTDFERYQIFSWEMEIKWQRNQRYSKYNDMFISESDRLSISLLLNGAFPTIFNSDVFYQKFKLSIGDRYKTGKLGKGQFLVEFGGFISSKTLRFIDFNHFNGNRILSSFLRLGDYQLLDYYQHSTAGFYLKSHLQHNIKPISIGKTKCKIRPVLSMNQLHTESVNYFEFGFGIEKVFKIMRFDFYTSFKNGKHDRLGLRFGYFFKK